MSRLIPYEHGICAIDAQYVRPQMAAVHLINEKGRVALVDAGSNNALPGVLAAIEELGLGPESVDYILLTHVHLDHAGGAGLMMQRFPGARLVVHPRGARHMIDPSRLVGGAVAVYGAEEVSRLYGDVQPVAQERIIEATDGLDIDFAGRTLHVLDTPGHARHHICIVDGASGHVFTGDAFGLSYREFDTDGRQFVFPTTTPVQFEPDAMHASIDRIMGCRPGAAYLTHFGQIRGVAAKAAEVHRLIDAFVTVAERNREAGTDRHARIRGELGELLVSEIRRFGCTLRDEKVHELLAADVELNAQGLGVWLDNKNK